MKKLIKNYLTDDELKVLVFLIFFGILGLSLKWSGLVSVDSQKSDSLKTSIEQPVEIKYDLRTATSEQLQKIKGIGPKTAESIINYRKTYGFKNLTDLMEVKGIGPKTYTKMKDFFVKFGNSTDLTKNREFNKKVQKISVEKIDINTASISQLTKIKGIGKVKAERILKYRENNGNFNSIEALVNVKGIGKKTMEKMKKFIKINGD